jgi:hypothetical protein
LTQHRKSLANKLYIDAFVHFLGPSVQSRQLMSHYDTLVSCDLYASFGTIEMIQRVLNLLFYTNKTLLGGYKTFIYSRHHYIQDLQNVIDVIRAICAASGHKTIVLFPDSKRRLMSDDNPIGSLESQQ